MIFCTWVQMKQRKSEDEKNGKYGIKGKFLINRCFIQEFRKSEQNKSNRKSIIYSFVHFADFAYFEHFENFNLVYKIDQIFVLYQVRKSIKQFQSQQQLTLNIFSRMMSNSLVFSARTTKMFDLNLTDSEDDQHDIGQAKKQSEKELNQQENQNEMYLTKQQLVSKSINPEQTNVQIANPANSSIKKNPVLKFKAKKTNKQLNNWSILSNVNQSKGQESIINLRKDEFSSKVRKMSGNRVDKGGKRQQQKKIQYLNNSNLMMDVEEINFSPTIKTNKKEHEWKPQRVSDLKQMNGEINDDYAYDSDEQRYIPQDSFQLAKNSKKEENSRKTLVQQQKIKEKQQSSSQKVHQQQSDEQNLNPILNSPTIKFKQVLEHNFQSSEGQEQKPQQNQQNSSLLNSQKNIVDKNPYIHYLKHLQYLEELKRQQNNSSYSLFHPKFQLEDFQQNRNRYLQFVLCNQTKSRQQNNFGIASFLMKKCNASSYESQHMLEFEVYLYKDLFKIQYQLRVKYKSKKQEQQSVLIATACNESFHIDKSIFVIEQVNNLNQREFIGQLESNFTRNKYTLFGYEKQYFIRMHLKRQEYESQYGQQEEEQIEQGQEQMYKKRQTLKLHQRGDIQQLMKIEMNEKRRVYIKGDKYGEDRFNEIKSLEQRYRKETQWMNKSKIACNQRQVMRLVSKGNKNKQINKKCFQNMFDEQFNKRNGVRKSNKTLLLMDEQNKDERLFIGKIASKRYKVKVGMGMSPLEAFGVVIAHVETN